MRIDSERAVYKGQTMLLMKAHAYCSQFVQKIKKSDVLGLINSNKIEVLSDEQRQEKKLDHIKQVFDTRTSTFMTLRQALVEEE